MELGLVGLGRMGGNMRTRLRRADHTAVGYDRKPDVRDVSSLSDLVGLLSPPRAVWLMLPHGDPTHATVEELAGLLSPDDLVVDGGNSPWTDDARHSVLLEERGIGFVDCGVSGGIWGLEHGYGLMAGGDPAHIERLMPVFDALAPEGPREEGFVHAGGVGAGHYAKMVHNGVEYGLMQAYAEGYELLHASGIVDDVAGTFRAWTRG
ncbi:MAG: NAD(P)-binding domain-containing protein, partial [bacterium]